MFRSVPPGPVDPVYILKNQVNQDKSLGKVDLGVGVYRNEQGRYHELGAVRKAKIILEREQLGHDYEVTTGNAEFLRNAAKLLFGPDSTALQESRVSSVQAISGTGSIHLAALFLSRCSSFKGKKVYIGTPAWGNYEPLFNLVGLEVLKYNYYNQHKGAVDFPSILSAVAEAPKGSIFVLQACCHNPSGADLSPEQWRQLAQVMKQSGCFPFFDVAYQGLGGSLDEDAYGVRHFESRGLEFLACQSFSKNFGLYGERCGVLHVVSDDKEVAADVYDQLRCLIRWEFSSSPAYGARLVNIILRDEKLMCQWSTELPIMRKRLRHLREDLYDTVVEKHKTPGNWGAILSSTGLFCFLPLTPQQCSTMATKHHIHFLKSGRINVSGLNSSNVGRIAAALYDVTASVPARL